MHNKKRLGLLVKILLGHKMFLIRGSLPASSFEGFRVAESLIGLGRIYPWCREHKNMETFQPTTGIIWMNSMWPTVKQFLCFKWVLNVFFLLFCLVWNLAAWAAPSLSALRSARVLCVCVCLYDCVTQSGYPGVRVSVCVTLSGGEALCENFKIKGICVSLIYLTGNSTAAQVSLKNNLDAICRYN